MRAEIMSSTHLTLTDVHIRDALRAYGVEADPQLCEKIRVYISTLLQWNAKISLTTITQAREILRVHFGESLFAASAAGIADSRVADIGTGAGFPGIPIRMVLPGVQLTLIEAVGKKAAFLAEVLRKIDIHGVRIIRCRMEDTPSDVTGFDFVTARALGRYDALLGWSKKRLSQSGKIALLLGKSEAERLSQEAKWHWEPLKLVPGSSARVVLVGSRGPIS